MKRLVEKNLIILLLLTFCLSNISGIAWGEPSGEISENWETGIDVLEQELTESLENTEESLAAFETYFEEEEPSAEAEEEEPEQEPEEEFEEESSPEPEMTTEVVFDNHEVTVTAYLEAEHALLAGTRLHVEEIKKDSEEQEARDVYNWVSYLLDTYGYRNELRVFSPVIYRVWFETDGVYTIPSGRIAFYFNYKESKNVDPKASYGNVKILKLEDIYGETQAVNVIEPWIELNESGRIEKATYKVTEYGYPLCVFCCAEEIEEETTESDRQIYMLDDPESEVTEPEGQTTPEEPETEMTEIPEETELTEIPEETELTEILEEPEVTEIPAEPETETSVVPEETESREESESETPEVPTETEIPEEPETETPEVSAEEPSTNETDTSELIEVLDTTETEAPAVSAEEPDTTGQESSESEEITSEETEPESETGESQLDEILDEIIQEEPETPEDMTSGDTQLVSEELVEELIGETQEESSETGEPESSEETVSEEQTEEESESGEPETTEEASEKESYLEAAEEESREEETGENEPELPEETFEQESVEEEPTTEERIIYYLIDPDEEEEQTQTENIEEETTEEEAADEATTEEVTEEETSEIVTTEEPETETTEEETTEEETTSEPSVIRQPVILTSTDGQTYQIAVSYGPGSKMTENAELHVAEITAGSAEYQQYLSAISESYLSDYELITEAHFYKLHVVPGELPNSTSASEEPSAGVQIANAPTIIQLQLLENGSARPLAALDPKVVCFGGSTGSAGMDPTAGTARETKETGEAGDTGALEPGDSDPGMPVLMEFVIIDNQIQMEAEPDLTIGVFFKGEFSYSIDGNTYDFSLPEGGYVSLQSIVEVLGIAEEAQASAAELIAGQTAFPGAFPTATDAAATDGSASAEGQADVPLLLDNIEISEATRDFVAEVETVEFSDPSLVWVGKVEEDTTVDSLKDANGLENEYNEELEEAQLEQINSTVVDNGDWALISIQPFNSEEVLTVNMKDGEEFAIRVKNTQIRKTVISASGETYEITVTYDDSAGIPEGSDLVVREILPEPQTSNKSQTTGSTGPSATNGFDPINVPQPAASTEYDQYVAETMNALGIESENVRSARFFDITIVDPEGNEVQPVQGSSVKVKIELAEELSGDVQALHFGEEVEALDTTLVETGNTDTAVTFEASSFSVYGIITTIETTVITAQGRAYRISVSYGPDAGVPEGASLKAEEILQSEEASDQPTEYEEYLERTRRALELESGAFSYARFFDISILDADGNKVQIEAPVNVKIELADKEEGEEQAENTLVVHFADDAIEGDVVADLAVEGDTVKFQADGFSAYAIVEGPDPVPLGWQKVESIQDLLDHALYGLSIGHPDGYFYMNTMTGDNTRMGITKTKPAQSSPPTSAAKYYFEQADEDGTQVYAYCYDSNGQKLYVNNKQTNSLYLTSDENEKTAFTVTQNSNGTFKFSNGAWYWNMQGGASGARFCAYNSANDNNNNVELWYYTGLDSDPYELDADTFGKTYGLMNWNGGVAGKALMAQANTGSTLTALPLTVLTRSGNEEDKLFVPKDSEISQWSFHWQGTDTYYLTTVEDGSTKYLRIGADGLRLVSTPDDACLIQVTPGTGIHAGEISLKSGSTTLTFSGVTDDGFNVGGGAGSEWLNLVDFSELTSDYYMTYSASKVSVADPGVTTGSKVIVYTRSWNDSTKKYEFYAINHDGTLQRCFESGDSIEWVGSIINTMLWQFTEYTNDDGSVNYYYELYNPYSDHYLAPQVTGGQIVAGDPIGINMNGRRYGQYYSTILAWDDANYAYAGLKVENGQIVSCPRSEAMDFYFAVLEDAPVDDVLHTVATVDHTQYGITMKIIDFETRTEMSNFLGNDEGGVGSTLHQGLLSTDLGADGYPTAAGGSLGTLYNGAAEVNHLFIDSTFRASGYYEFDSSQNFAHLVGDEFVVYKELGSYDSGGNKPTLKHGQFFPFNDIEAGIYASINGKNLYSTTAQLLPDSDPRKNEQLYLIKNPDCYFGVELEASFTQTPSGLDDWGHDIIFEFTGDDDFWLYVDDELIIDLGGIHSAVPGSVNFRTGAVNVNGNPTTLRELMKGNYRARNDSATDEEVQAYLNEIFGGPGTVFPDYTTHTMRIFYMERGAGASNLHMRFNLASVKPGTVELTKELSGVDSSESPLAEFAYQIKYKKNGTEYSLTNAVPHTLDKDTDYVFYKDTTTPVTFLESIEIDGITYEDVFILKPGDKTVINFPIFGDNKEGVDTYRIIECGVNTEVYSSVYVNGSEIEGTPIVDTSQEEHPGRKDYGIDPATTADRPRVNYVNQVDPEALRTLTIKKELYDESGENKITDPSATFNFRLYFGTESDSELALANMYTYHVKDPAGNYCRWDASDPLNPKFVSIGKTDYTTLTDAEKEAVSFATSINGQISRIPAEYTIEVRQILAGTKFRVVERPWEIPDGFSFQKYQYNGEDSDNNAEDGVSDTITSGQDSNVIVRNLKGWGLRVNKVWTDADYMEEREPVYFAVFVKEAAPDPDSEADPDQEADQEQEAAPVLTLVEGTVRQMPYEANPQSLYWYFEHLPVANTTIDDYVIREVTISAANPTVDADGVVTDYGTVTPIEEGGRTDLSGLQKGEQRSGDDSPSFPYTVHYEEGSLSEGSNVRVDTVTNDRPGLLLRKTQWDGETALSGAVFTLTDDTGTIIGTFTSDAAGLITVAYLREEVTYQLKETKAPAEYHGLGQTMNIRLDQDGEVHVSGVNEAYYILTQGEEQTQTPPMITIKNRQLSFCAVKIDGDTGSNLAGAHFALHRQVTVDGVTAFDVNPMPGYEDLVTAADGTIPKIDQTLPAGVYELREKTAPGNYEKLPSHIYFNVSALNEITLVKAPEGVTLSEEDEEGTAEAGPVVYTLTVRNYSPVTITLKKIGVNKETGEIVDEHLGGAAFTVYESDHTTVAKGFVNDPSSGTKTEIELEDLVSSYEDGIFFSGILQHGTYYLHETEAPEGYNQRSDLQLTIEEQDDKLIVSITEHGEAQQITASDDGSYLIEVENNCGYELPFTGGTGTRLFTILGGILIALAGILFAGLRLRHHPRRRER
ncbi:MAG: hypothetical protein IJ106_09910 [Parasporobacterium sp.]|nr:hypothetical protein [Parasporobacterium sp.]